MEKRGSGKSEYCFQEIISKLPKEKKIYMITPEQFSFTAESKLMKTAKSHAVIQAEVVTLSRMAYRVLNEVGGNGKTHLTKQGKAMLIYSILNQYKKELKFLGKTDENIDLIMRSNNRIQKTPNYGRKPKRRNRQDRRHLFKNQIARLKTSLRKISRAN